MIVKNGELIAINSVKTDNSLTGNGVSAVLGINTSAVIDPILSAISETRDDLNTVSATLDDEILTRMQECDELSAAIDEETSARIQECEELSAAIDSHVLSAQLPITIVDNIITNNGVGCEVYGENSWAEGYQTSTLYKTGYQVTSGDHWETNSADIIGRLDEKYDKIDYSDIHYDSDAGYWRGVIGLSAIGDRAHAEGSETTAAGKSSHAEGFQTFAEGMFSRAAGLSTHAIGMASNAEGCQTVTNGDYAHAEGYGTHAQAFASHTEGDTTVTGPTAYASHAEGDNTVVNNIGEHAEGRYNISHTWEDVEGATSADAQYNTTHSIGIGIESDRMNALEIMQNGDMYLYGVGGYSGREYSAAETVQDVINKEIRERKAADSALSGKLDTVSGAVEEIRKVIPDEASEYNKLADKAYVDNGLENLREDIYLDVDALSAAIDEKQDILLAGENIAINDNTVSVSGTLDVNFQYPLFAVNTTDGMVIGSKDTSCSMMKPFTARDIENPLYGQIYHHDGFSIDNSKIGVSPSIKKFNMCFSYTVDGNFNPDFVYETVLTVRDAGSRVVYKDSQSISNKSTFSFGVDLTNNAPYTMTFGGDTGVFTGMSARISCYGAKCPDYSHLEEIETDLEVPPEKHILVWNPTVLGAEYGTEDIIGIDKDTAMGV